MAVRTHSASFYFSDSDMPIRFGRYLLLKRKNRDPVGEEFLAAWGIDEGVDQLRILRGIYPSVAEEDRFVKLFSEEARSLSRLASANVVRVIEVGAEGEIPFVACEYVEGATLMRLLELAKERKTACPWELAVYIATELLRGLDYVHRREDILGTPMGMRHGDVRPSNIIISFDGEVKLTNFGSTLYYIVDEKTNARVQTYRGIFAPPEHPKVEAATVAGDLWGVAAILSALLGRGSEDREGDPLNYRTSSATDEIDAFLTRAMHPSPSNRFTGALAMRDKLLSIMRAHATGHPPDDLADWARSLAAEDRIEEERIIREMLGQDGQIHLGDTADGGKLSPGTVLDNRYHLLRLLGEGGMGLIFEAEHLGIGRHVAVKVLHERVLDDQIAVERFRREAQITGSLGHPNIVHVSDFGVTAEGYHYLVMDLLEGESLGDRIDQGTVDPWELIDIMAQVCDGLEAAHQAGVVHRDLKPENIFLTGAGPRILDFGIAKRTGLEEEEQSLTNTGFLCGTAEYLAPEQVRGQEPDYRSDTYAAGVIIYEALTRETPFRGRNIGETLHKVMSDKIVPPRKRSGNRSIPKELEAICLKALMRNPNKRFSSAAAMASALRKMLESAERKSSILPSIYRPGRGRFIAALSGVVLLGAVAVYVLIGFADAMWESRDLAVSSEVPKPTSAAPEKGQAVQHLEKNPKADQGAPTESGKLSPPVDVRMQTSRASDAQVAPIPHAQPPQPKPLPVVTPPTVERPHNDGNQKQMPTGDSASEDHVLAIIEEANAKLRHLRFEKAEVLFRQAIEMDQMAATAWYGLGQTSFEKGKFKEAVVQIKRALTLKPRKLNWRIYLGKVYMATDRRDKAIDEWRKVLEHDPSNEEAKMLLGDVGAAS
ncbi:MAG: protein kinase [Myxococcota bacterium]|nr:protein kinase [Myxococcota bacterium]